MKFQKWDLTAVKETSKLCFGDPEFIFSKLPYDWFIPKGASDNNVNLSPIIFNRTRITDISGNG